MRFDDLWAFNRDFWWCVILGFDWGFVKFCPNGGSEDFGVDFGEIWLIEISNLDFLVMSRVELL